MKHGHKKTRLCKDCMRDGRSGADVGRKVNGLPCPICGEAFDKDSAPGARIGIRVKGGTPHHGSPTRKVWSDEAGAMVTEENDRAMVDYYINDISGDDVYKGRSKAAPDKA